MPRFDKTGPEGKGAQTGRGMGKCNPRRLQKNNEQADFNDGLGRTGNSLGTGRGRGRRRGLGRLFGGGRS